MPVLIEKPAVTSSVPLALAMVVLTEIMTGPASASPGRASNRTGGQAVKCDGALTALLLGVTGSDLNVARISLN